ncbi:MAG: molecular chaperone TorD family protein [Acidimicrobiales bacterium]
MTLLAGRREALARSDLITALAAVCDTPSAARSAVDLLGLGSLSREDYTRVFVLNCPPHASVHLGPEGGLGGAGAERVAMFWRSLGITPGPEPDHLASLLALYAALQKPAGPGTPQPTSERIQRARRVLLCEHLWAWVPGYTRAVEELGSAGLSRWAVLTRRVLQAEMEAELGHVPASLANALRNAPAGLSPTADLDCVLDTLVTPVRSGIILTNDALAKACSDLGLGHRVGERRFALRAMLEQGPGRTLGWLAGEAKRWAAHHDASGRDLTSRWWAGRARHTARRLAELTDLWRTEF